MFLNSFPLNNYTIEIILVGINLPKNTNPRTRKLNTKFTMKVDGSFGEGGGQILRTALALSTILQRPVEIRNIRAGRKKPGLRPQHLMCVKALSAVTSAHMKGAELGSMRLSFKPQQLRGGTYALDIGTAGSTGLVLQAMIPGLLLADGPSKLTITGGTHVPWSPCFQYLQEVLIPALKEMGCSASLELARWGWYPKGGGRVVASISPVTEFCAMERSGRSRLNEISVLSAVSNLPMSIGERQRDRALKRLATEGYEPSRVESSTHLLRVQVLWFL